MDKRQKLKSKFEEDLSEDYLIQWKVDKDDSPLVIKLKEELVSEAAKRNKWWINALCYVSKTTAEKENNYTRINLKSGDNSVHTSIYDSGTIMFQGQVGYEKYLLKKHNEIISSYKSEAAEHAQCNVCSAENTEDMIQCYKCKIWIHKECDIDQVIEMETAVATYYCPKCRMS